MQTKHPDFEEITEKRNREAKTYPVRVNVWCGGCDANHVAHNEKCSVCGFTYKTKHRKR
jgi:hypothetical protein